MVEIGNTNLKGTTLVETLVAMIIIALAFGFSITFLSNKSYAKNLKSYQDSLELRKLNNSLEISTDLTSNTYQVKESIFLDSLCIIKETFIFENTNQSVIEVNPIIK